MKRPDFVVDYLCVYVSRFSGKFSFSKVTLIFLDVYKKKKTFIKYTIWGTS